MLVEVFTEVAHNTLSGWSMHRSTIWAVSSATLLRAIDNGRNLEEFITFLALRAGTDLPESLLSLLTETTHRASQLSTWVTGAFCSTQAPK